MDVGRLGDGTEDWGNWDCYQPQQSTYYEDIDAIGKGKGKAGTKGYMQFHGGERGPLHAVGPCCHPLKFSTRK